MKRRTTSIVSFVRHVVVALFASSIAPVDSVRILAVEPVAGKSHWNFMSSVLRALAENGHHVTVFTPFPDGDRANYTEIDISGVLPPVTDMHASELFDGFCDPYKFIPLLMNMTRYNCQLIYDSRAMRNVLNDTVPSKRYDIVIAEISASECISYPAAKLNLPVIYVIPSPIINHIDYDLFGHVPNPAAVSHFTADHVTPKTFGQRLGNLAFLMFSMFSVRLVERMLMATDPQPYDLVDPVKPSLVFTNTHYITETARPLPPNVVQIGGVHLKPPGDLPTVSTTTYLPHNFEN